jgi:hypothetical protein
MTTMAKSQEKIQRKGLFHCPVCFARFDSHRSLHQHCGWNLPGHQLTTKPDGLYKNKPITYNRQEQQRRLDAKLQEHYHRKFEETT